MKKKMLAMLLAAVSVTGLVGMTGCQGKGTETGTNSSQTTEEKGNKKGADKGTIIVGSKGFTENLILSELYALALEDAGYKVDRQFEVSNAVIHESLCQGEIDLYPEYTGSALMTILQQPMQTDPETVYTTVKDMYAEKYNLDVLDMCQASDGNGLAIRKDVAEKYGIKTISDLQQHASDVRFGSTSDFMEREDGMLGLERVYGTFNFKSTNSFDNALKYQVMSSDEVDCVPGYTTDAQLSSDEFLLLEDDKQLWPPYNIIPVVRQEIIDQYPDVAEIINGVSAKLDTATMTKLNAKVDIDKEEYDDVAADFYEENLK